jgi:predicted porin
MNMKRNVLLGASALVGLGLMALPANAQMVEPAGAFTLEIDGEVEFRFTYQSTIANGNPATSFRNHWLRTRSNFDLTGEFTTDSGLEFSFENEIIIDGDDDHNYVAVDDVFVTIKGNFGRLDLGELAERLDNASLSRTFTGGASLSADPKANGADPKAKDHVGNVAAEGQQAALDDEIIFNKSRDRIIFETPAIVGVVFKINYTPNASDEDGDGEGEVANEDNNPGDIEKALNVSAEWEGTISGADVTVTLGYAMGMAEDQDVSDVNNVKNDNRWRFGAEVEHDAIEFGGYMRRINQTAIKNLRDEDETQWGIGGTYTWGLWEFGAAYEEATREQNAVTANAGDDNAKRWDIAAKYDLGHDMGQVVDVTIGMRNEKWEDNLNAAEFESNNTEYVISYNNEIADGVDFEFDYQYFRYDHHEGKDPFPVKDTAHGIQVGITFEF